MSSEYFNNIDYWYSKTTDSWVKIWGDHLHHGYYDATHKNTKESQTLLIEKLLEFGGIAENTDVKKIVDMGCGVGGSTRYLATRFHCESHGVNICRHQVSLARSLSMPHPATVDFFLQNALATSLPSNQYDLVWSCESAEHIPNHTQFINECNRLTAPRGRIIIATWVRNNTKRWYDAPILSMVSKYFSGSLTWIDRNEYESIFSTTTYTDVQIQDWTQHVYKFWILVVKSILTRNGIAEITKNKDLLLSTISIVGMMLGFVTKTIQFAVITAIKK